MRSVGDWVALVCFISLALLGWVVIFRGMSWLVVFAGLWWLGLGIMAGIRPDEWRKRERQ